MKALKPFLMLCCCMAAVMFTSCSDDEDTTLTPEERQEAFQTIKGNYDGDLIYAKLDATGKDYVNDTLKVSWEIDTDSTLTIANFPATPLATYITNEEIGKAIAEQSVQKLGCSISIFDNSPIAFFINPASITYQVDCDGEAHKVQFDFFVNYVYSYGVYSNFSNINEADKGPKMQMQILVDKISVDGKLQKETQGQVAKLIVFRGKK